MSHRTAETTDAILSDSEAEVTVQCRIGSAVHLKLNSIRFSLHRAPDMTAIIGICLAFGLSMLTIFCKTRFVYKHPDISAQGPRLPAKLNLPILGVTILGMNSVRIAVIVTVASFTAFPTALTAQQDTGTHVKIQVTDRTGASIPKAQVKVMSPEDGKLLAFTADSRGIADLHLEPGEYQYRVASSGFCPKNSTATVDAIWPLEIRAELEVENCPGPCSPPCVTPIGVEPPGYQVTIKVSDLIGAFVSGALVEIDPSSPTFRAIETDGSGQATIGLPAGMHSLRVNAPGFHGWKGLETA